MRPSPATGCAEMRCSVPVAGWSSPRTSDLEAATEAVANQKRTVNYFKLRVKDAEKSLVEAQNRLEDAEIVLTSVKALQAVIKAGDFPND